jgi:parallel beta-helix repeat protein
MKEHLSQMIRYKLKHIAVRFLALYVVLSVARCAYCACPATLYVAVSGQEGWSGKLAAPDSVRSDGPLPSLTAAQDRIRQLRASGCKGAVHVVVRGGVYRLQAPFQLAPEDSGTPSHPVVYEAYPGEKPIFSGGRIVTGWSKDGQGVWSASETAPVTQLFVNGTRARRARAPYDGYFRIGGKSSTEEHFLLHYTGDDIKPEWAGSGAEVVVLLAWAEMRRTILSVDPVRHIATLSGPSRSSTHEETARYWVENVPDETLGSGEWRQDTMHHMLFYKPRKEDEAASFEFVAPRLSQLVVIAGDQHNGKLVHDIELRGLTFSDSAWAFPEGGFGDSQAARAADAAIQTQGAVRIRFNDCTFHAMGGYAIHLREGSSNNRIDHNNFYDLGGGAVRVGEETIPKDETGRVTNNAIEDNEIHSIGLVYPSAVAVWVGQSSSNSISHNHMYDLPYSAISVGWTWGYGPAAADHNKIEFNSIHDLGTVLSDLGGIYLLGRQPGTIVRNNVIHDVSCFTYGGWGIYLDEGSSEIVVTDNIVYNTQSSGFHQHYGRDNIVRNNTFAFGREYQLMRTRPEPTVSFRFERNIVLFDQGALLGYNWSGGGYAMDHNLYWDMRGERPLFGADSWDEWRKKGNDLHSLIADPLFVRALSYDFRLQPQSPALALGIHTIAIDSVGPREQRAALKSVQIVKEESK